MTVKERCKREHYYHYHLNHQKSFFLVCEEKVEFQKKKMNKGVSLC